MRPLYLKIKGLNSFVEEQTIDFEKLTKRGFFGIFGPTGSGKSTILDGMILALYGMKAISRGTNEFVNKNCKNAQVSYEFQISGTETKRYRVEREFKATPKGTKSGKCRLLELTDGERVLEESVSGVDKRCAEIIGLTADDFMRTVVLPQGKFSEFLKVSGKERREILERLFRLEEYGVRLEERIVKALREEKEKDIKLSGEALAYRAYSEETCREKEEWQKEQEQELKKKEADFLKKREEMSRMQEVWELQGELAKKREELCILREKQEEIEIRKEKLLLADRAGHVVPILQSVKELEKKEEDLQLQIREIQISYEQWKEVWKKCDIEFAKAEQEKEEEGTLIADRNQAQEALELSRELPALLAEEQKKRQRKKEREQNCQTLEMQERRLREEREQQKKQLEQLESELCGSVIASAYREKIDDFHVRYQELERMEEDFRAKTAECEKKEEQAVRYETFLQRIQTEEAKEKKEIESLKERLETLNQSAKEIQILELQKNLKEGEPCPVCGSMHFERRMDAPEREQENELHVLEEIEQWKEVLLRETETLQQKTNEKQVNGQLLEAARAEAAKTEAEKRELEAALRAKKETLFQELEAYQIKNPAEEKERIRQKDAAREALEEKIRREKKMQEESQQNVQQFQECLERQKEEGRRQEMELALLCEKISQKRAEIAKKIGEDREPEQYFQMAQKRLLQMQENYKQKKQQKEQAERSLKEKEETWNSVNGEERGSRAALEQAQSRLLKEMEKQGFSAREEVEYALLTDAVCQVYTEQVETYERQLREAEVQAAETEKKLNGRKITRECYESCVRQCSELEEQIPSHRESVIAGKQELQRMYEGLERQRELMRQKELLAHNIAVLEDLQSVTRGKRFVEFMAMERLKYISKSASKRLYEITNGNYELEINGEGEFVIRDNKNGGVIRQTSTLSGGETFVTSLALALALSAEIQLKGTAPLELFFLDEGFGSLDETLLDIVMESLEKIHHEQLKVGIISHVESVKTRVPVRLLVSPAETGVSGSKVRMEYS